MDARSRAFATCPATGLPQLLLTLVLTACTTSVNVAVRHRSTPFPVMDTLAVLPIALTRLMSDDRLRYEATLDTAVARARLGQVTLPTPEVRTRLAKAGLAADALPVWSWRQQLTATRALDTTAIRRLGEAVGVRYLLRVQMEDGINRSNSEDFPDSDVASLLAEIWEADSVRIVWQASGSGTASRFGTGSWSIGPGVRDAGDAAIRALGDLLGGAPIKRASTASR